MGIQDSVNSMIGSVATVTGANFLKEKAVAAEKNMAEQVTQMKSQKDNLNMRIDKLIAEGRIDNTKLTELPGAKNNEPINTKLTSKDILSNDENKLDSFPGNPVNTDINMKIKGGLD